MITDIVADGKYVECVENSSFCIHHKIKWLKKFTLFSSLKMVYKRNFEIPKVF